MSDETLDMTIKMIFECKNLNDKILINWHAGEPLMAGMEFYQKANDLIKQYCNKQVAVEQSIQTNGTLLNEKWCDFLKQSNIGVSVSLDGPEFIHNANRVNWGNRGSFDLVMRGIELLKKNQIPFYTLMVLTEKCLDYPGELYNFFVEQEITSFGFNVEEMTGSNVDSSLEDGQSLTQKYKSFIGKLADLWLKDPLLLGIREFENISRSIFFSAKRDPFFYPYRIESTADILTIKRNGDIVPFSPEMASGFDDDPNRFVVGNVHDINSLEDIYINEKYKEMAKQIITGVNLCKQNCEYFSLCGGGNPGNKYYENKTFACTETNHCRYCYQYICDILLEKFATQRPGTE